MKLCQFEDPNGLTFWINPFRVVVVAQATDPGSGSPVLARTALILTNGPPMFVKGNAGEVVQKIESCSVLSS